MSTLESVERVKNNLKRAASDQIEGTPVDVLVLGPKMEGSAKASAALRKGILERCRPYGQTVIGEHAALVEEAKRVAGAEAHNLCSYEMLLAAKVCDVVIIVPDSPGSFAELGLFAMAGPEICAKTLVLFEQSHRDDDSYLMGGPRKACEIRGSRVAFVDYGDVESAWLEVEGFLKQARQKKTDRKFFG